MSRKGKQPITVPNGVNVSVADNTVTVKGPKATLTQEIKSGINVNVEGNVVHVELDPNYNGKSNFHGLYRSLIANLVKGTSVGFETKLEMIGVGYRASVQGNSLDLQIGVSHPVSLPIPEGIQVKVDKNTLITVSGADKQQVGQFAAKIRAKRPPEPYQGKGIRYVDEYVRRKAGKAAAKK
ncbi:hypothetical protein BN1013_00988 [Candidatus Rubidus massiliensis]|nr:MAG: 50S ribosomal protein L6 [Chlamydia sp. 32-24]CDZ80476.1 hypothetical protein BN1013_00988 [Candidatus Rubidus massiliensis]